MIDLLKLFNDNKNEIFIYDAINNREYTYNNFFVLSMQYFEHIKQNSSSNNIVTIMDNSIDLFAVYFACLVGNYTVIPIDPLLGDDIKDDIQKNIGDTFCIYDKLERHGFYPNISYDIINQIDYERNFLITHTSGTTGKYKGVKHSFQNLVSSALALGHFFKYEQDYIFYHNMPMSYMAGILNLFITPLVFGCKIVIDQRFDVQKAGKFWNIPNKYNCKVFWLTPTIISILNRLDRGTIGINYIKNTKPIFHVGTAPLYDEVRKLFEEKYNTSLYASYGLSETLFITTEYPLAKHVDGCTGNLLPNVDYLLNDNELCFKTPWMFNGYTNVDTNDFFLDKYYKSGDLGIINDKEKLFVTGRVKDLIIKGGINISVQVLENFLFNLKVFDELAIVGQKDNVVVEKIICFFVSSHHVDKKYINSIIGDTLGIMYKIDDFKQIDNMPKNINGKIDKNTLRGMLK